jgi:hypothetical protein
VQGPRHVVIKVPVEQLAVPYKRTTVTITADKTAIAAAIKAGREVEGAEMSNPAPVLRVTPF